MQFKLIFTISFLLSVLTHLIVLGSIVLFSNWEDKDILTQNMIFRMTVASEKIAKPKIYDEDKLMSSSKSNGSNSNQEPNNSIDSTAVKKYISEFAKNYPPAYPVFCRRNSIEGYVLLKITFVVGSSNPIIVAEKYSGSKLFINAALKAAEQWDYSFAGNLSRNISISQKIIFSLN